MPHPNFDLLASKLKIDVSKVDDEIYDYLLNYREELVNAVLDYLFARYDSFYYPTPNDIAKRAVTLHSVINRVPLNHENRKKYYDRYSIKAGYQSRKKIED